MNERELVIGFFGQFYELVVSPLLHHTVAELEWKHFCGLLQAPKFEPERVHIYLSMLEGERHAKEQGGAYKAPPLFKEDFASRFIRQTHSQKESLFVRGGFMNLNALKISEPVSSQPKRGLRHFRTESAELPSLYSAGLQVPVVAEDASTHQKEWVLSSLAAASPSDSISQAQGPESKRTMREMLIQLLDEFQVTQVELMR